MVWGRPYGRREGGEVFLEVVATPVPAPGGIAPPLFSATRDCAASRFHPMGLSSLHTMRTSNTFISSISPLLSLSHLSLTLHPLLSLSLAPPSTRVSFFHRGWSRCCFETGLVRTSRRVSFLYRGGLLSFQFRGDALALLRRSRTRGDALWQIAFAAMRALARGWASVPVRACLSNSHVACGIVFEQTPCSITSAA